MEQPPVAEPHDQNDLQPKQDHFHVEQAELEVDVLKDLSVLNLLNVRGAEACKRVCVYLGAVGDGLLGLFSVSLRRNHAAVVPPQKGNDRVAFRHIVDFRKKLIQVDQAGEHDLLLSVPPQYVGFLSTCQYFPAYLGGQAVLLLTQPLLHLTGNAKIVRRCKREARRECKQVGCRPVEKGLLKLRIACLQAANEVAGHKQNVVVSTVPGTDILRDAGKDIPQIIGQHEKLLIDGLDFPVDVLYVQDGGFLNILILHSTQRLAQIQVDDGENQK